MTGRPIGKNWTGQFIQRHKDQLESVYLRNIDNMRTKSRLCANDIALLWTGVSFCIVLLYFEDYKLISTKLIAGIEKYYIIAENMYN
jgi:hypothetical protein